MGMNPGNGRGTVVETGWEGIVSAIIPDGNELVCMQY
jgi:hypothetical protein